MKTRTYLLIGISILLGFQSVHMLGASPNITQGPWVSGVTRSTALLSWVTDQLSNSTVKWGTVPGFHPNTTTGDGTALIHSWFVAGAPANSRVYYVVCSSNGADPTTCSAENSFVSAPALVGPRRGPLLLSSASPTPVDDPVAPSGNLWTVDANCDDPSTGLVARWNQASWGDIVEIDPTITPMCAGSYVFPAKPSDTQTPHRYILTRVKKIDSSVGNRQVQPSDKGNLARFVNTAPNVIMIGSNDPAGDMCFAGNYRWRQFQNNAWAMYRCNNLPAKPINSIPAFGTLDITVPGHGFTSNKMVHISGVTGSGSAAVNGDWYIQVLNADTVRLLSYIGSTPQLATGLASGGQIQLNQFQLEPVTEGSSLPVVCNYGDWWHLQAGIGSQSEYNRTWYCNATNQWLPYRMDPSAAFQVIDLITNHAHHLMFQGLSFEPMALKADPQRAQYTYQPASQQSGTLFGSIVGQSRYSNHVYWDRILAQCPDPDPNGSMVRCQSFANPFDGSNVSVKNSYFSGFQVFHSLEDLDDGAAVVLAVTHGPGPHEIVNNHIECAGICVYYTGDVASTSYATDLTFVGNLVQTPDRYWDQSPSWLGKTFSSFSNTLYWSQRHRVELKRLIRGLFSGNIFVGGWVWINNASGICLCTRGGAPGAQISSLNGSTITTYDATPSFDWGVEDLKPGDLIYLQNLDGGTCSNSNPAQVFTVSGVTNSYTFTVSPSPGCASARGNVARVANATAYISDVRIVNNVFAQNPTGIVLAGHDGYGGGLGLPSNAMQRIAITNNLAINVDGTRVGMGTFSPNPSVAPAGSFVIVTGGMEDATVSHNTVYPRTIASFINSDSTLDGPSSGHILKSNLFQSVAGSAIEDANIHGTLALTTGWIAGLAPAYDAAYNVILRSGGAVGNPFNPALPPYGPYPLLTKWFDTNAGPFPFRNPAAGDYSLTGLYRAIDTCYATPGDCTDDGKDVGVDMSVLPSIPASVLATPNN